VPDEPGAITTPARIPACCLSSLECCSNEVATRDARPRSEARSAHVIDLDALPVVELGPIEDAAPAIDDPAWGPATELAVVDEEGRVPSEWVGPAPRWRWIGVAPRGRASIIRLGDKLGDFFDHPKLHLRHAGLSYLWRARADVWTGDTYADPGETGPGIAPIQPLSWLAVTPQESSITYEAFRGHYHRDHFRVATKERWSAVAVPVIDDLVFGFRTRRGDDERLHLIMPGGGESFRDAVALDNRGSGSFAVFSHVELPLAEGARTAAVDIDGASVRRWETFLAKDLPLDQPMSMSVSVVRTRRDERAAATITFTTNPQRFF
jgi:hypothetical protein